MKDRYLFLAGLIGAVLLALVNGAALSNAWAFVFNIDDLVAAGNQTLPYSYGVSIIYP